MKGTHWYGLIELSLLVVFPLGRFAPAERVERFDKDPGWDGFNNWAVALEARTIRQDFGYSNTHHARGQASGEMGGLVFRGDNRYRDRLAYYGDRLRPLTLEKPLRASGKVCLRRGVSDSTTLLGFFHSTHSVAVSPSQASALPRCLLGIAIEGPSSEGFYFYPVYALREGEYGSLPNVSSPPRIYPDGEAHEWTLEYTPEGAGGRGRITVTLDGKTATLDLGEGHKQMGAEFDRFGLVTTCIDGNGQRVYFDDLRYTCSQD